MLSLVRTGIFREALFKMRYSLQWHGVQITCKEITWSKQGFSNGLPVIRQKPGGNNALGLVKFIFPNSYNIYFHDTPSKGLFQQGKQGF
jgi:murein L,D-transpeptidase YcbB/YkuD